MMEEGPAREVFEDPRNPYTVGLLRCIPRRDTVKDKHTLDTIPGFPPSPGEVVPGVRVRRPLRAGPAALPDEAPPLYDAAAGRQSRCHFHERAHTLPRVIKPEPEAAAANGAGPGEVLISARRRVEDVPHGGRRRSTGSST